MSILIFNVGSSSIKYSINDIKDNLKYHSKQEAEKIIIKIISDLNKKNIKVTAIGHRVVHGGTTKDTIKIDKSSIKQIEKFSELAPLHNYPQLNVIKICTKLFKVPQFAVFDTAFHAAMPAKAFTYALPAKLCRKYNIRKYGFHGTSHNYVSKHAAKLLGKPPSQLKLITCHLGNGSSVSAVCNGHCIDTSMGFTPLEGLVMGTRCGDIDPALVYYIMKKEKLSTEKIDDLLNKKSGLLGISEISNDMPTLEKSKDKRAKLAIDIFCYRIKKYIGAYMAAMNGADAIIFTAGIGENEASIRENILSDMENLGVLLDKKRNYAKETLISSKESKVKVLVIPTKEDLLIKEEVERKLNH